MGFLFGDPSTADRYLCGRDSVDIFWFCFFLSGLILIIEIPLLQFRQVLSYFVSLQMVYDVIVCVLHTCLLFLFTLQEVIVSITARPLWLA